MSNEFLCRATGLVVDQVMAVILQASWGVLAWTCRPQWQSAAAQAYRAHSSLSWPHFTFCWRI